MSFFGSLSDSCQCARCTLDLQGVTSGKAAATRIGLSSYGSHRTFDWDAESKEASREVQSLHSIKALRVPRDREHPTIANGRREAYTLHIYVSERRRASQRACQVLCPNLPLAALYVAARQSGRGDLFFRRTTDKTPQGKRSSRAICICVESAWVRASIYTQRAIFVLFRRRCCSACKDAPDASPCLSTNVTYLFAWHTSTLRHLCGQSSPLAQAFSK